MSFLLFPGVSDGGYETIEPILLPVEELFHFNDTALGPNSAVLQQG